MLCNGTADFRLRAYSSAKVVKVARSGRKFWDVAVALGGLRAFACNGAYSAFRCLQREGLLRPLNETWASGMAGRDIRFAKVA